MQVRFFAVKVLERMAGELFFVAPFWGHFGKSFGEKCASNLKQKRVRKQANKKTRPQ
jgi:hypothetical protein